jgi:hypothetical protein
MTGRLRDLSKIPLTGRVPHPWHPGRPGGRKPRPVCRVWKGGNVGTGARAGLIPWT